MIFFSGKKDAPHSSTTSAQQTPTEEDMEKLQTEQKLLDAELEVNWSDSEGEECVQWVSLIFSVWTAD